ncbi:kinase-like domain-containing protein [Xylaria nigripes]|nr:kinase-like domain-containing protein [Xylaria nigripes]
MEHKPINDTFLSRVLTLGVVKILNHRYIKRFRKRAGSVLSVSRFCIKIKPSRSLAEADTMRFVARNTSIPVPKVFCAFTHKGRSYIVMEKIAGDTVGHGWTGRTEESKRKLLAQLKSLLQQLRDVRPPQDIGVANVTGGPIYDGRLFGKSLWGPFSTQEDFHRELRNGIGLDNDLRALPSDLVELLVFHRRHFPPPVLTHGDLSSLNILVRDDRIVGIINWETAGWLPYYWEYVCARNASPQNEFWQHEVDKFLDPMCYELRMEDIRRRYFGKRKSS